MLFSIIFTDILYYIHDILISVPKIVYVIILLITTNSFMVDLNTFLSYIIEKRKDINENRSDRLTSKINLILGIIIILAPLGVFILSYYYSVEVQLSLLFVELTGIFLIESYHKRFVVYNYILIIFLALVIFTENIINVFISLSNLNPIILASLGGIILSYIHFTNSVRKNPSYINESVWHMLSSIEKQKGVSADIIVRRLSSLRWMINTALPLSGYNGFIKINLSIEPKYNKHIFWENLNTNYKNITIETKQEEIIITLETSNLEEISAYIDEISSSVRYSLDTNKNPEKDICILIKEGDGYSSNILRQIHIYRYILSELTNLPEKYEYFIVSFFSSLPTRLLFNFLEYRSDLSIDNIDGFIDLNKVNKPEIFETDNINFVSYKGEHSLETNQLYNIQDIPEIECYGTQIKYKRFTDWFILNENLDIADQSILHIEDIDRGQVEQLEKSLINEIKDDIFFLVGPTTENFPKEIQYCFPLNTHPNLLIIQFKAGETILFDIFSRKYIVHNDTNNPF